METVQVTPLRRTLLSSP